MNQFLKRTITLLLALVTVLSLMPMANADAAALKQGSSGSQVKSIQQNLIGLGYLSGSADGSYGPKTREAVRAFQSEFGLSADGTAGDDTQTALRNAVVRLQRELKDQGFNPGTADGQFGSQTKTALKKFQKEKDLPQTGEADSRTWAALNSGTEGLGVTRTLRRGSSGKQVKYLQMALITLGYLSGSVDGSYGAKTQAAVKLYQSDYGLSTDGTAGPDTLASLKNTVVALQSDLARKGYYTGAIDSICGDGVRNAVKRYQRAVGITTSGVAGAETMRKLYGRALSGSGESTFGADGVYKIWIDSLYQDADYSKVWFYNGGKKSTTVKKSGCGGVALAMALNALLDTREHTGQSVMQWFANNGYYAGNGTYQSGLADYPTRLGLNTSYCDRSSTLISHLKKGRLAIAIIRDKTGDEFFTYSGSRGHYILISGYRDNGGVDQVFVNNPLSSKASTWFDIDDLMANACNDWQGYDNSFVIIYD